MVTTASDTQVRTGRVRLSYVHVFEPFSQNNDEKGKYSCVLLVPKSDTTTISRLREAEQTAYEQGVTTKWKGKRPKNPASIIHDGDEEADLDANPEYAGHFYMSISSKTRPGIVDKDVQPILDSSEVYSGCYARVQMNAYPYNYQGKLGVSFGLNHIQKIADGDYLGGRSKAEDVFEPFSDEADSLI